MRTVIFDLDGTLADTSGDLIAAANRCFADQGLGLPLDPLADQLTAFHGGRAMLRLGYARLRAGAGAAAGAAAGADGVGPDDEEAVARDYPRLLAHYARDIMVQTRPYPGAIAAVETLRARGFAVGICTNKPADLAESLLQRMGIRGLFAAMIGADTLPVRKPDPAPYRAAVAAAGGDLARSMLVGDTETDRRTAAAAGVPVALVTFGPEGPAIARLAPEALLNRYEDLPDLAESLLGAP